MTKQMLRTSRKMDLKLYHKIVSCILRFEGFVRNASGLTSEL